MSNVRNIAIGIAIGPQLCTRLTPEDLTLGYNTYRLGAAGQLHLGKDIL